MITWIGLPSDGSSRGFQCGGVPDDGAEEDLYAGEPYAVPDGAARLRPADHGAGWPAVWLLPWQRLRKAPGRQLCRESISSYDRTSFCQRFHGLQSTAALRDDGKSSGIRSVSGEGVMFSLWHYYIILYFALQGTKLYKKENIYFDIHINFDIDFRSREFPAIKNAPEGSGKRKDSVFGKGAVRTDGDRSRK